MSIETSKQINRDELYEQVWKTPMTKLAEEWGVPVANIVKACTRLNVPRPGSGHWALLQRGWEVQREPLPPCDTPTEQTIVIHPSRPRVGRTKPNESVQTPATTIPRLKIPKDPTSTHALVKESYRALKAKDTYTHLGIVHTRELLCPLNMSVSPQQVDRAVGIMAAIVKEAVNFGLRFERGPERWRLRMFLGTQPIDFGIKEKMKRRERHFTDEERASRYILSSEKWEWYGSGLLRFWLGGDQNVHRREWEETKRSPLEVQLAGIAEIFANIHSEAAVIKAKRAQREKQEEERRQKEFEIRQRQYLEENHRQQLVQTADAWTKAEQLREFVRRCESELRCDNADFGQDSWQAQWLEWAQAHVDRIDPLKNGFLAKEKQRLTSSAFQDQR